MKLKLLLAFMALTLVGCGEPEIDGSDQASFDASVEVITAQLSDEKKARFINALKIFTASRVNMAAILAGNQAVERLKADVREQLDGKTADDVIDEVHDALAAAGFPE